MDSSQISNNKQGTVLKKKDYLSTEKINLGNFSAQKISSDLDVLKSAEKKNVKTDVSKYAVTEETAKEMLALKLANPFRGY
jgi:hypothetical protein